RTPSTGDGGNNARKNGARGRLRPPGWRISSLFGGRKMARSPFRKDELRQFGTAEELFACHRPRARRKLGSSLYRNRAQHRALGQRSSVGSRKRGILWQPGRRLFSR